MYIIERIVNLFQGTNWLIIPAALLCIVFHEVSHGIVAYWLGDPTAKQARRLTLNPIHHLDVIGLLSMIIFGFGWAKPVPVNPYYFKNRKQGMSLVALAGPLSNFLFAIVSLLLVRLLVLIPITSQLAFSILQGLVNFLMILSILNVGLAVFNLIPISPLDGSKILISVLPDHIYNKILQFERYGFLVLILLLNIPVFENAITAVRTWIYDGLYNLIF